MHHGAEQLGGLQPSAVPPLPPPHKHDSPSLASTPETNNKRPVFSTSGHLY
jgi:hypothetical protein